MGSKFTSDLWQLWNTEIKAACENSTTLLMAVFSLDGELLMVNEAMKTYFQDAPEKSFINPEFDSLVKITADDHLIFTGFITFGNINSSKNISIQSKVYRQNEQIMVVGEVDVNQLIFVNDRLFELNSEVNDLQRKLLKEKAELTKAMDELKISQNIIVQSEIKIKSMLTEKEILLKEVHHRIKNNMNTIKSLLFLQADSLQDPTVVAALNDAESRVESMMLLYDKLYRSDGFRELSVKEYLPLLVDEIISNFPNKEIVKVEKHIDDFILDADTLSPLGIIINELLTNIMKYAFTGRSSGLIIISASSKDKHTRLVIEDNGIGLPKVFDFKNSTGFGMQLVSMLTEQIKGSISVERVNGTKFVLEF